MRYSLRSAAALCGAGVLSSSTSLFAQSSTWVGPVSGTWNVAANWSNGVPGLGGPTTAIINGGPLLTTITLNASPSLASLVLGANTKLLQPNNADLTLGGLTNDGLWELTSTGASTDILLNADATFTGNGTILLGSSTGNRILGSGGTRSLVNAVGHTIAGGGQVGINTLHLINHGLIEAVGSATMHVDLAPTPISTNDGVLQARDGGTLNIYGSEINNVGGTLRAGANGTLVLRSSTIHGGLIDVLPSGIAYGTFEATTFENVTLQGIFLQPDNADSALLGTLYNAGVWKLASTGAGTELRIAGDPVTLDGPGALECSDSAGNRIITSVVGRTLVNSSMHTIRGAGLIGAGGIVLHNAGVIEASEPTGFVIDCAATPTSINSGYLDARDGAPLLIVGTPLDNQGGMIRALNGGIVTLQSSTIAGGTIGSDATGEVHMSVYPPTLSDLSLVGTIRQLEGTDVKLAGTIVQEGTWRLEGTTTTCEILLASDVVHLEGAGTLLLTGADLNNRVHSAGGTPTLVNGPDHHIRGGGDLCWGDTVLDNEGTIVADAHLIIDTPDALISTNAGAMSAEEGGWLELSRANFVNTGTITVGEFSLVSLKGTTIAGGLLTGGTEGPDDGLVLIEDSNAPTRLDSVIFDADGSVANGTELRLRSHLTNDGRLAILSTGTDTNILLEPSEAGTVTIDGDGVLDLSDSNGNRIAAATGTVTLIHGADHTIAGAGRLGNGTVAITNYGTIESTHATPLKVSVPGASIGLANHGVVRAASTGELRVEGGAFTNDGTIESALGSSLVRIGSISQSGGLTRVDGGLTVTGTYTQSGGLLAGDGIVSGDVWIQGGSASPSGPSASAIGSLNVVGDYSQTLDGGLIVDLGVDANDHLTVSGVAKLGGALQIRVVDPFVPMPGQEFTILSATTVIGTFGCIEFPQGAGYFHVVYAPQSVKLVVDATPVREADLNFDGFVGSEDLAILLGAWGDEPCGNAICCPADLNGDGKVNAPDLATLLGDWG